MTICTISDKTKIFLVGQFSIQCPLLSHTGIIEFVYSVNLEPIANLFHFTHGANRVKLKGESKNGFLIIYI